mmetsp:Transcript_9279/g.30641  ORF Transcript_9279/g.30641 Transcript_9279/m.30641 type:complete len:231 (+) Transcript_9279:369-1061(+)
MGTAGEANFPEASRGGAIGVALPRDEGVSVGAGAHRVATHRGEEARRQAVARGHPPAREPHAPRAAKPAQGEGCAHRRAHRRERHLRPALGPVHDRHAERHFARGGEGFQNLLLVLFRGFRTAQQPRRRDERGARAQVHAAVQGDGEPGGRRGERHRHESGAQVPGDGPRRDERRRQGEHRPLAQGARGGAEELRAAAHSGPHHYGAPPRAQEHAHGAKPVPHHRAVQQG